MNTHSEEHVIQYNPINEYDQQYYFPCFNDEQNDCSTSLKVINDMLMEDEYEYENEPYMFHDFSALQATERSFFDALHNNLVEPESFDTNTNHQITQKRRRRKKPKKKAVTATSKPAESVDWRSLLTTCAQAASSHDTTNATHLLQQIRQHSSPEGDNLKRVAHYFANALEASLSGTGTQLCSENYLDGISTAKVFSTRFKEALFTFSNMFDMLEATVPREDESRLFFEEVFGNTLMNVIACEGTERVHRPEMYKLWQIRMQKAGFTQLPLDQKIVKQVRSKMKKKYHKNFYVDEDGKWMLQGWKGRVNEAISCWKPSYFWM